MNWKRQLELIPDGTNTRSKVGRFPKNTPITINQGQGAYVYGDDGKKYLDFQMGLGAILLGYSAREEVLQAVDKQFRRGSVYGLPSLLEGELAEQLIECYPHHDMVRFGRNGVDATTAAVRLARAITGKDKILFSGYHGCADWYEIYGDNSRGIPNFNGKLIRSFQFNDINQLRSLLESGHNEVGVVIIEQPPEPPNDTFYKDLAMLCRIHGAIWIQDEIVTGFRYGIGGAQERYGFKADLTCVGKALSNGLPISALLGSKEHMMEFTKGVSWSSTFGGELTAISGALACIKIYSQENLTYYTENLTNRLKAGLREAGLDCIGEGGRLILKFNNYSSKMAYLSYMHSKNIFIMDVPIFLCMSHTAANIERTIDISREYFESI